MLEARKEKWGVTHKKVVEAEEMVKMYTMMRATT